MVKGTKPPMTPNSGGQKGRGFRGRNFCPPSFPPAAFSPTARVFVPRHCGARRRRLLFILPGLVRFDIQTEQSKSPHHPSIYPFFHYVSRKTLGSQTTAALARSLSLRMKCWRALLLQSVLYTLSRYQERAPSFFLPNLFLDNLAKSPCHAHEPRVLRD